MNTALAVAAALVASLFVVDLARSWRQRPRPHVAVWTLAMSMYTLATWALAIGLGLGWSGPTFRVFYLFGAILNVPFLALGSAYLVLGPGAGRRLLEAFVILGLISVFIVVTAPFVGDLPERGLPAGSDIFAAPGSVGPTGPRFWALVGNSAGTVALVGLAAYSAGRFWRVNRRLVGGNGLIVLGTLSPALGGTLVALGEAAAFASSLLLGAALLWAGYRVASTARRPATTRARLRQNAGQSAQ